MNEKQLAIVISVINNAATQLGEVGEQLASLGTDAEAAAEQMQSSLTAAEEQIVAAAEGAASAWGDASGQIAGDFEEAVPTIEGMLQELAQVNEEAAVQVAAAWQSQSKAMEDDLAAALATVEEDTTAAADKVQSTTGSMHGYFRALIAAYALERVGGALLGGVENAVSAAAGNPDKIAQLTDQINQQKAAIAQHEAELQKWLGPTAAVNASHQAAAANIAAEKDKIQELQQQLQPLLAVQQAAGDSAQKYDDAVTKLNNDWQIYLATQGSTLLPLLTKLADAIDTIVTKMTAWADAHPKLTEVMLIFAGVLGGIMIALGALIAAITVLGIIVVVVAATLGTAFVAWGAVVAVVIAAAVALIATNWNWIRDETTKLVADFEGAWNSLAAWWTGLWNGIYNTLESAWGKIQAIVNSMLAALAKVTGAVSGVAGAVGGGVSSAVSSVANVLHVNDAIITPGGQVIQTDVSDYLFATKNPGALAGGGGSITINIQGGNYLDSQGANMIAAALATQIQRQIRLKSYV